ncbi:hypothetical protein [Azospirillum griseum]|uniref:Uncharacterized protein n=1 Tax=Azospirillum griseum TaxID=2496639 RepID=A0A3S0HZ30_9PROT|nr:hypothetical protein [Azospirillum griseum]RTR17800.1 hypothetical protein EJ903_16835 [Azospirillum griseum]
MMGFSGGEDLSNGIMAIGVVGVLLLACLMWIGASVLRSLRHIAGVRRRFSGLIKQHATLERDLSAIQQAIRHEQDALIKAEEALDGRRQEVAAAEERLRKTRVTCVKVYELLHERYSEKDRLWLVADGENGTAGRWAVAAPDEKTATELVRKKADKPSVEGKL